MGFSFEHDVGEMLANGIGIEREQVDLLDAPGGALVVAAWGVPEPCACGGCGYVWAPGGTPLIIPAVMKNCLPTEEFVAGRPLFSEVEPDHLKYPTLVGEDSGLYLNDYPVLHEPFEVADDHSGRQIWDVWPVAESDAMLIGHQVYEAFINSGYFELCDYINWENGNDEPESVAHQEAVESAVLDPDGYIKDPLEFEFKLHLPREQRYIWERLLDTSQQGWTDLGLTFTPEERKRFFNKRGRDLWFSF